MDRPYPLYFLIYDFQGWFSHWFQCSVSITFGKGSENGKLQLDKAGQKAPAATEPATKETRVIHKFGHRF